MKKNKIIKVLVISHKYSGIISSSYRSFIHEQIKHILNSGCEITVVSPQPYSPIILGFYEKWKIYRQIPECEKKNKYHVFYPRYIRLPGAWFHGISCFTIYLGIKKTIHHIIETFKPNILFVNTATPDGYVGLMVKKKYKIPLVCCIRGSDINLYPFRDKLTMSLTKKVISLADQIVSVSYNLKEKAESLAKPKKLIKVVYNGCDTKYFAPNKTFYFKYREKLGILPKDKVLIFVGDIKEFKGIFELMDTFILLSKKYSNLHLLILGDGPRFSSLESIINTNSIKKKIHLLGRRPIHEVPKWLNTANVFVLPTYYEGLPNAVLEAMACGLPLIATNVGGIPEVLKDGVNGFLIKDRDVNSLLSATEYLLNNEDLANSMGYKGRKMMEQKFLWSQNAEQMKSIFHELLYDSKEN